MSSSRLPTIVTTDLSSELHLDEQISPVRSSSDHGAEPNPVTPPAVHFSPMTNNHLSALSPLLLRVPSTGSAFSTPGSTVYSQNDRTPSPDPFTAPPSPTLSTMSDGSGAPNMTSLALRDNHPKQADGYGSLALLNPNAPHKHRRKDSTATFASTSASVEGTEPDRALTPTPSFTTNVASHDDPAIPKRKDTASSSGNPDEKKPAPAREAPPEEETDAPPMESSFFTFPARKLASLVDPKNMSLLVEMGGLDGILRALGTSRTKGLSEASLGSLATEGSGASAGTGRSRASEGERTAGGEEDMAAQSGSGTAFDASIEERRRFYSVNALPARQSKSLLQLMWLALKDRVLVSFEQAPLLLFGSMTRP